MTSSLRRRLGALHQRLGSAGFALACIALVLALTGGAFAASAGLNAKQKKEVKKIAKSFQGTGPQGAKGDPGPAGANGKDGVNGSDGAPGKNAEATSFTGNAHGCPEGGIEVKSASPVAYVCNGAAGQSGFTETLPSGETETGSWGGSDPGATDFVSTIGFAIPLAQPIDGAHTEVVPTTETKEHCDDGVAPAPSVANPEADPGYFCVFQSAFGEVLSVARISESEGGADRVGATVLAETGFQSRAYGTWAVTAP